MNIKLYTKIFLAVIVAAIVGYDIFAVIKGGTDATISNVIIEWSYGFPAMTFAIGFVSGHLFWKIRPVKKEVQA